MCVTLTLGTSRSGFRVITTCSPPNFDLVKSRGADGIYDYSDIEKCTQDVKASVRNDLQYAYVCVMNDYAPQVSISNSLIPM